MIHIRSYGVRSGLRTTIAGLVGLAGAGTIACGARTTPEPPASGPVESIDQILVAVPDSAMRERWRTAEADGQLPALSSIPTPETRLEVRERPPTPVDRPDTPSVTVPQGAVADVRLATSPRTDQYSGSFSIERASEGIIIGRIEQPAARVEIHYELPGETQLAGVPDRGTLSLAFREGLANGSMRRELFLGAGREHPVLVYLSDGGDVPYSRQFEALPLAVRQAEPSGEKVADVIVTYAGQEARLAPGDRQRFDDEAGVVEVIVTSSFYTPRGQTMLSEGDPYHVILMLYRVQ